MSIRDYNTSILTVQIRAYELEKFLSNYIKDSNFRDVKDFFLLNPSLFQKGDN